LALGRVIGVYRLTLRGKWYVSSYRDGIGTLWCRSVALSAIRYDIIKLLYITVRAERDGVLRVMW